MQTTHHWKTMANDYSELELQWTDNIWTELSTTALARPDPFKNSTSTGFHGFHGAISAVNSCAIPWIPGCHCSLWLPVALDEGVDAVHQPVEDASFVVYFLGMDTSTPSPLLRLVLVQDAFLHLVHVAQSADFHPAQKEVLRGQVVFGTFWGPLHPAVGSLHSRLWWSAKTKPLGVHVRPRRLSVLKVTELLGSECDPYCQCLNDAPCCHSRQSFHSSVQYRDALDCDTVVTVTKKTCDSDMWQWQWEWMTAWHDMTVTLCLNVTVTLWLNLP